jgi:hypothetical protein
MSATARPCVNLIANRVRPDNPSRAISRLSCIGSLSSGSVESGPSKWLLKSSVFRQRAPGCLADQLELRRLPEQAIDAHAVAGNRGQGDLRPLGDGLDEQSNPMGDSRAYALAKRRTKRDSNDMADDN